MSVDEIEVIAQALAESDRVSWTKEGIGRNQRWHEIPTIAQDQYRRLAQVALATMHTLGGAT